MSEDKRSLGQFYTTRCAQALNDLPILECLQKSKTKLIIEPFAGKCDILWSLMNSLILRPQMPVVIKAYDLAPPHPPDQTFEVVERDTLTNPPDYKNAFVITNPPYLARNKVSCIKSAESRARLTALFALHPHRNDLYKIFISQLCQGGACGGVLIIPSSFFLSPRESDVVLRHQFMSEFTILKINYFEERVFDDTSSTIVSLAFVRRGKNEMPFNKQLVNWRRYPSREEHIFEMNKNSFWMVGGVIYHKTSNSIIKVKRFLPAKPLLPGWTLTFLTLRALDGGRSHNQISLDYKPGYIYPSVETSRSFATLAFSYTLSEEQQKMISKQFNHRLKNLREQTWSLFLPQFRESVNNAARKRLPFELAYKWIGEIADEIVH
jgi:hypothetical protein